MFKCVVLTLYSLSDHKAASLCVGVGLQQGNALQTHLLQLREGVQLLDATQ